MPDRYADIKNKLCELAEKDEDIRAVIAIGSYTRKDSPADQFSDLDLIIVTTVPESWYSGEYPAKLGEVGISFIDPTLGGGAERSRDPEGDAVCARGGKDRVFRGFCGAD